MSVAPRRAYGMLGTAAEWVFQLDRVMPCCDNVGVGMQSYPALSESGCDGKTR